MAELVPKWNSRANSPDARGGCPSREDMTRSPIYEWPASRCRARFLVGRQRRRGGFPHGGTWRLLGRLACGPRSTPSSTRRFRRVRKGDYEDAQGSFARPSPHSLRARPGVDRPPRACWAGHVVEIGCGKGDFLRLICRRGLAARGTGFDPAFVADRGRGVCPALIFSSRIAFTEADVAGRWPTS